MEPRRNALLSVIVVAGLLLVYLVYGPSLFTGLTLGQSTGTPPPLSSQPFHQSFISEETCLACHAQERELPAFGLTAPEIGHELRKDCVSCHQLPRG